MSIRQQGARSSCIGTLVASCFLTLAACGGDDGPGPVAEAPSPAGGDGAGNTPPPATDSGNDGDGQKDGGSTTNSAPKISGQPPSTALADNRYVFEPTADDADGDALTFSISYVPDWATFSADKGRIEGTPGPGDVGTYTEIVISVSDGQADASLGAFDISVEAIANGAVTLDWMPPQLNTDGTPLTDLAGFHLYWGTEPGDYSNTVTIENPGVTTHVLDNLVPDTYYFAATAFNADGMESDMSNETSETVL